jgi:hypothetical protein
MIGLWLWHGWDFWRLRLQLDQPATHRTQAFAGGVARGGGVHDTKASRSRGAELHSVGCRRLLCDFVCAALVYGCDVGRCGTCIRVSDEARRAGDI